MVRMAGDGGITASGLNPHGDDLDQYEGANQDPLSFGGSVGRHAWDPKNGYTTIQDSRAQELAGQARGLAMGADGRKAPKLDVTGYDQSRQQASQARGQELYGLDSLRQAATGGVPSAAAIGGRLAGDQALQAQLAAQAGRGGAGTALAANQAGAYGMAGASQQAGQGLAGELALSRGQFQGLAGDIRGRDFASAKQAISRETLAADVEARQRALNAQREAFYNAQELATQRAAQQAGAARQNIALDNWSAEAQAIMAAKAKSSQEMAEAVGAIASTAGTAASAVSDERMKTDIRPVGAAMASSKRGSLYDPSTGLGRRNSGEPDGLGEEILSFPPEHVTKPLDYARYRGPYAEASRGLTAYREMGAEGPSVRDRERTPTALSSDGRGPLRGEGISPLPRGETRVARTEMELPAGPDVRDYGEVDAPPPPGPMAQAWDSRRGDWADRTAGTYGDTGTGDGRGTGPGPRGSSAAQDMLRSTAPVAYRYKPGVAGEDPSKERYGVLAQDLERSPMGASLVHDTPRGKVVDTRHAALASLAVGADLQRQIDQMKAGQGPRLFAEEQLQRWGAQPEPATYGDPAISVGRTGSRSAPEGYRARGGEGRLFGPQPTEGFDARHGLAPGSGDFYRTEDIDEQRMRRARG